MSNDIKVTNDPFAAHQLTRQTSGRSKSPVGRIKATPKAKEELGIFVAKVTSPGYSFPLYHDSYIDWLIQGAISTESYVMALRGNLMPMKIEAAQSGVRLTGKKGLAELQKGFGSVPGKGDNYTHSQACNDVMPGSRFGKGNWHTFKDLPASEQVAHLTVKGALA